MIFLLSFLNILIAWQPLAVTNLRRKTIFEYGSTIEYIKEEKEQKPAGKAKKKNRGPPQLNFWTRRW